MYGLDLFSGIGGITKALEGYVTPIAYCENDRYAQSVLLSRMAKGDLPIAPIWDDVKTITTTHITPPEIIYGGFPCQDISVAGRAEGLGGKRSGLFSEIVRLTGELQPQFVFLENVPAIRSRGADVVVGELARLGYDCRWISLSAAEVGANHRRERWWLLAHSERSERRTITEGRHEPNGRDTGRKETPGGIGKRRADVANATGSRRGQMGSDTRGLHQRTITQEQRTGPSNDGWWKIEPNVGRVVNGLPFRVDRLRGLGNAVVPTQAREAFKKLMGLKETMR